MPAEGKITLDAKQYETMLARVQTKTAGAASQMGKDVNTFGRRFGKVGSAIGVLAGSAPAQFGQIGQAIQALVLGPMGALIAVIGTIVTVATDMWDRLTLSSDEFAKRNAAVADEVNKEWEKTTKRHDEDQGYMQRLEELSRKEDLSNAAKTEAARLIAVLTSRYGALGASIDAASGKITGLDRAMQELARRQQKSELDLQKRRVAAGRASLAGMIASRTDMGYGDARSSIVNLREARAFWADQLRGDKRNADIETSSAILAAIDRQMELENQLQQMSKTGERSTGREAAALRKRTDRAQRKTDYFADEAQEAKYQELLNSGKEKEAEIYKTINDLKRQGIELSRKEAAAIVEQRRAMRGDEKFRQDSQALKDQLHIQELLVKGKKDEARQWEIIYSYIRNGMSIDRRSVKELDEMQQKLGGLKLREAQQDQARSLYAEALRASGRDREAAQYTALQEAREKKGSDLTDDERSATLRLVELARKLESLQTSPGASLAMRVNDLTARGGGGISRSTVETAAERYNREMLTRSGTTNSILREIQREVKRQRVNQTYVIDPSS